MSAHPLDAILHPKSVAVVGASPSGRGGGFITPMFDLGFKGIIYPVNPKYKEMYGLKTYPTVRDIPGEVDFVISSIPAQETLKLVDDCAAKHVKAIHFFTARFSETGRADAADLEKEILKRCKAGNVRIIGPNCMGVFYPAWGLSFFGHMPKTSGHIGVASQSGGAVGDIVEAMGVKGLYCSKGISYGNALDFNEADYLEYFGEDPDTNVILMYIEGVRAGKRFFNVMREVTKKKPVIVLKGGRGKSGTRATASHTASLAGSMTVWNAAIKQAGGINAVDIDEMVDIAAAFNFVPPMLHNRVGVCGGSGGSSVMGADQSEEAGLDVIPLPEEIRAELKAKGSPIWDWISNPADFSIGMGGEFNVAEVVGLMAKNPNFDFLILFMMNPFARNAFRPANQTAQFPPPVLTNPPAANAPAAPAKPQQGPWGNLPPSLDAYVKQYRYDVVGKPLFIIQGDRGRNNDPTGEANKSYNELREKLIENGIVSYPNIKRAANAAAHLVRYYQDKKERTTL
ncbi:MAG: CoA-binding protein [Dehalococcoidales bacterium]|nr:CoA-binding protein [Dehalococcoidales bacterium]